MSIVRSIERKLTEALAPARLTVTDESHRHEGHAGARPGGETHFHVEVVSAAFAGRSRIERHRMVTALLGDEFAGRLHALSLITRTPEEDAAAASR